VESVAVIDGRLPQVDLHSSNRLLPRRACTLPVLTESWPTGTSSSKEIVAEETNQLSALTYCTNDADTGYHPVMNTVLLVLPSAYDYTGTGMERIDESR
jgi:hypothetical protein